MAGSLSMRCDFVLCVCVCAFVCMRQEAHLQKDISNVLLAQGGRHTGNKDCVSLHLQLQKVALLRDWVAVVFVLLVEARL